MKQEMETTPSMPVKDELLDITPGTWVWEERNKSFYIEAIGQDCGETTAVEICKLHGDENIDFADAKAICAAVNNTYGKGYNPAAMEGLYNSLLDFMDIVKGISNVPVGSQLTVTIPSTLFGNASTALQNAKTIKP